MDNYSIHLAMAALVGASFVAVSAYYMHRKTLSQLLEFAKSLEREEGDEQQQQSPRHHRRRRRSDGDYRRASASLPDVTAFSGDADCAEKRNSSLRVDSIPDGLPRLRNMSQGKTTSIASSASRSFLIRPTSPRSPVASAFESVEGSDDEDNFADDSNLDSTYLLSNGNAGPEMNGQYQDLPGNNNNGEQAPISGPNMIRSHSISGDLHGVQPDPIAADILRKEPEQETFVRDTCT